MSCAIRQAAAHTLRRAQRTFWSDMPRGASSTRWFEELFGYQSASLIGSDLIGICAQVFASLNESFPGFLHDGQPG